MRTVAVMNLKGGVGKTTTVVNMASILVKYHHQRVLVIDADSQCNATEFLGGDPEQGNLATILQTTQDTAELACAAIRSSNTAGVDILSASDNLMDLDLSAMQGQRVNAGALRELRLRLEAEGVYDTVLVDCPPAFSAAAAAALVAADEVIIPIKLDAFSLRGMANLLRQVANMRRINDRLRVGGCLVTMWHDTDNLQSALATLKASKLPVYKTLIRRSDKVDDMTFAQTPLAEFSPRSAAGVDYKRFVRLWAAEKGV